MFRIFDYAVGRKRLERCFIRWHSGFLLIMFLCYCGVYFFDCCDVEEIVITLAGEVVKNIMAESKICCGTCHLIVRLILLLLRINLIGVLPYRFPLGSHIVVTISLAFPFWFMRFGLNFNINFRLMWIKSVCEGNPFLTRLIVLLSDFLRIMIRPFTLAARLSLNVIIGSVLIKVLSSIALGVLFPFSNRIFFGVLSRLALVVVFFVEMFLMRMQAMVFCGLVVSYISEVLIKPE